jgi:hypothetical protein
MTKRGRPPKQKQPVKPVGRPKGSKSHSATYDRLEIIHEWNLLEESGLKYGAKVDAIAEKLDKDKDDKIKKAIADRNRFGVESLEMPDGNVWNMTYEWVCEIVHAVNNGINPTALFDLVTPNERMPLSQRFKKKPLAEFIGNFFP